MRFQEYSGNAALCGRDLPPEEVLASSQHVDACARALRAAGIPGTLPQLRALAFLDLTQGLDPLDRTGTTTPAPDPGSTSGAGADGRDTPHDSAETGHNDIPGAGDEPQDGEEAVRDEPDDDGNDPGDDDGPGGGSGGNGPRPGSPAGPGGAGTRGKPPVKAVINLLVPPAPCSAGPPPRARSPGSACSTPGHPRPNRGRLPPPRDPLVRHRRRPGRHR